jgi:hypothetical protein
MFARSSGSPFGVSHAIWQSVDGFIGSLVFVEHALSQDLRRRIRFLFGVGAKGAGFGRCVKANLARLLSVVAGACRESSQGFRLLCHGFFLQ